MRGKGSDGLDPVGSVKELALSLVAGFVLGFVFAWLRLPIPAPPALSGVLGIVGIFLGYQLARRWSGG